MKKALAGRGPFWFIPGVILGYFSIVYLQMIDCFQGVAF